MKIYVVPYGHNMCPWGIHKPNKPLWSIQTEKFTPNTIADTARRALPAEVDSTGTEQNSTRNSVEHRSVLSVPTVQKEPQISLDIICEYIKHCQPRPNLLGKRELNITQLYQKRFRTTSLLIACILLVSGFII